MPVAHSILIAGAGAATDDEWRKTGRQDDGEIYKSGSNIVSDRKVGAYAGNFAWLHIIGAYLGDYDHRGFSYIPYSSNSRPKR